MNQLAVRSSARWDQLGIAASLVCALHCATVPLLLPLLGAWGLGFFSGPAFELGMIALAAALGLFAVAAGFWRHHRQVYPLYLLAVGFLFLGVAKGGLVVDGWEGVLLPAGAVFIAVAHGLNWWLCRACPVCRAGADAPGSHGLPLVALERRRK